MFLFARGEVTFKKIKQSAGGNNDVGHKYEVLWCFFNNNHRYYIYSVNIWWCIIMPDRVAT